MSPRVISANDVQAKNQLYIDSPWRWLYEIEVPSDPLTRLRLAQSREDIVFGTNSTGAVNTYYAASIAHGVQVTDTEATLPTVNLTISNISREVESILETYNGLVGEKVRILFVNLVDIDAGSTVPTFTDEFEVLEVEADERDISAKLGQFNLFNLQFPNTRYTRDHCGFQFKGPLCQYAGVLTTCDKTLNGANGCTVHANADRFGGEPGIPRISGGTF